jgi:hypothetical protein
MENRRLRLEKFYNHGVDDHPTREGERNTKRSVQNEEQGLKEYYSTHRPMLESANL